jgi:peroxiredoxin
MPDTKEREFTLTPSEIIATSELYGGKYDDTMAQIIASGVFQIHSMCINFPNMHAAASWANANDISGKVNILFHPIHFDEPLSIRYEF